jgi:hypothetical protein
MKRTLLFAATALILSFAAAALVSITSLLASHHENGDGIRVPFAGQWAIGGEEAGIHDQSGLDPDWAVDYYAAAGTSGSFLTSAAVGTINGDVVANGSACSNPNLAAGRQYKLTWRILVRVHADGLPTYMCVT